MSAPTIPSSPAAPPAARAPAPHAVVADDWPADVEKPPEDLPEEDGANLETSWHRDAINLLVELIRCLFFGRTDFFAGGNMFIHFSRDQVRNRDFRGPDVFYVKGVDGTRDRPYWAVWDEHGRYPNVIVELLSPTTADVDRTTKKDIYEQTFRTPEYFLYDPATQTLEGWRLDARQRYQPIRADERGRLWSEQLGVWLGKWTGHFQGWLENVWLRFYTESGELVPLFAEQAQDRADKAEAEVARVKAWLAEKGLTPPE